jgi:hypothetical protein
MRQRPQILIAAAQAIAELNDALREEGLNLKHVTHIEGVWYCGIRDSSGNYYGGSSEPDPLSALLGALAQARRGPSGAKLSAKRPAKRQPPPTVDIDLDLDDLL